LSRMKWPVTAGRQIRSSITIDPMWGPTQTTRNVLPAVGSLAAS
jgi:hypothetical protein